MSEIWTRVALRSVINPRCRNNFSSCIPYSPKWLIITFGCNGTVLFQTFFCKSVNFSWLFFRHAVVHIEPVALDQLCFLFTIILPNRAPIKKWSVLEKFSEHCCQTKSMLGVLDIKLINVESMISWRSTDPPNTHYSNAVLSWFVALLQTFSPPKNILHWPFIANYVMHWLLEMNIITHDALDDDDSGGDDEDDDDDDHVKLSKSLKS